LGEIQVDSPEGWINLAAQKIRFRLIDLARKYKSDLAMARAGRDKSSAGSSALGMAAPRMVRGEGVVEQISAPGGSDRTSLTDEDWANFHLAVESLPADELQVFTLRYYGGWNREETAAILGVSEKTVSRRYTAAMEMLSQCLQDERT
jgi:RNA polymerase sigma factor (sigma-70 family)